MGRRDQTEQEQGMSVTQRKTLKVLVTGAAGRVGSAFRADTAGRYRLRLADLASSALTASNEGQEVITLDVREPKACLAACEGVDVVLHLAADPSPEADFGASLLQTNIAGTYNIFRAAKQQGCRRVVFASSAQAVEGYPLDAQVSASMPIRPKNMYGVSKCFGEAVASYFAFQEGLSSIAVRIGCFEEMTLGRAETARDMSAFVSRRDLSQLLIRCVEAEGIVFAIAHGVSDNRFKRLDLSSTQEVLGYEPEDDAFRLLQIGLEDW